MIRKIKKQDKKEIIKLFKSFPSKIQNNLELELKQAISNLVEGFILIKEKEIVGYIILRTWGGVYNIDTLVIKKGFRGFGLGEDLIHFSKKLCIKENIPAIITKTFLKEVLPFYKKQGFKEIGQLQGSFVPLDKKRIYLKWTNPQYQE